MQGIYRDVIHNWWERWKRKNQVPKKPRVRGGDELYPRIMAFGVLGGVAT